MTSNQENESRESRGSSGNLYGGNLYGGGMYGGGPYGGPQQYGQGQYGYGSPYYGGGTYGAPGAGGGLSMAMIMRIIKRFWFLIALLAVAGGAAAWYALTFMAPVYATASIVEMSLRKPRILSTEGAVLDDGYSRGGGDEIFNSRIQKLRSSTIKSMVVEAYREAHPGSRATDADLMVLLRDTGIIRAKSSRNILFNVAGTDPELIAHIANAYADTTELAIFRENKETSDKAVSWLQTQAAKQRALLDASERGLLEYRNKNQLDTLESEKESIKESSIALSEKLVEIESDTVLVREMLKFIDEVKDDPSKVAELPNETPGRAEIMAAMVRLRSAISERNLMLSKYTPKHPEMLRRGEEITDLGKQLLKESERARASVANSLRIKDGQVSALKENLAKQANRISEIELQTVRIKSELNALERERDATEISYQGILKRIEEARLSADEETAIVTIIERAGVPEKPIKPNRMMILALGVMLGLGSGFGIGLLVEVADDRVRNLGDIEQFLGLKVIGIIPRIKKIQRHELALASLNNKFGHITEAFAGVVNLLESPQYREFSRSVLVASSTPEEGKTISASNVACMFAKSGKKTLLIDFDMRRPRLARIYRDAFEAAGEDEEERKHKSLLHCLHERDAEHFSQLPLVGPTDNLDIITSQPSREISAAEVMTSQSVRELIDWAHARYDRVIIDSPPLGVISDSSVLASLVGCVIVVIRPEKSRKKLIGHMLERFNIVGANIVGTIVNDLDLQKDNFFDDKYKYMNYSYQRSYNPNK